MSTYPAKVSDRFLHPKSKGGIDAADAEGVEVSLICGTIAKFFVDIEPGGRIVQAKYLTNGCGFAVAAAEVLAGILHDTDLEGLHGLDEAALMQRITTSLGPFPNNRLHCAGMCIGALRNAFSSYRTQLLDEFRGEKPLICTCFGVSEESVENCIRENSLQTVDKVAELCRAGAGCGACRMLIQEIIDSSN